jgi:hypothetical protein
LQGRKQQAKSLSTFSWIRDCPKRGFSPRIDFILFSPGSGSWSLV